MKVNIFTLLLLFVGLSGCLSDPMHNKTSVEDSEGTIEANKRAGEIGEISVALWQETHLNAEQLGDSLGKALCECLSTFDIAKGAQAHKDFLASQHKAGKFDLQARRDFEATAGFDATMFVRCDGLMGGYSAALLARMKSKDVMYYAADKRCPTSFDLWAKAYAEHIALSKKALLELDYFVSDEDKEWGDDLLMRNQQAERVKFLRENNLLEE